MSTIDIRAYTAAFRTWAPLAIAAEDRDTPSNEETESLIALVDEGCRWLEQRHRGVVAIEKLCADIVKWSKERPLAQALPLANKSCLLARLIYGGEQLRTRPCPIHLGRWSGIGECPAGCGDGNITGWLPNDLVVEDWPAIDVDPTLAAIEEGIDDPNVLSVYADRLQQLGDPRGAAIAERSPAAIRAWLGSLFDQPWIRFDAGFLDVKLGKLEHVRALFDAPAGRYVRRVTIDGGYESAAIARYFATRKHAWVTTVDVVAAHLGPDDRAALLASCRHLRF